jgi:hypothetical protein
MAVSPTLSGREGLLSPSLRRQAAAIAVLAAILAAPIASAGEPHPDDMVDVVVDRSRLIKLPDRVATIVVGNPLIADATLQAGGLMVLTGKGYGTTNVIALDRKGNALLEKIVQVLGPQQDVVVVYKGVNRETYSCAPACNPTITLGDFTQFFAQSLAQTTTRSNQAIGIVGNR